MSKWADFAAGKEDGYLWQLTWSRYLCQFTWSRYLWQLTWSH